VRLRPFSWPSKCKTSCRAVGEKKRQNGLGLPSGHFPHPVPNPVTPRDSEVSGEAIALARTECLVSRDGIELNGIGMLGTVLLHDADAHSKWNST